MINIKFKIKRAKVKRLDWDDAEDVKERIQKILKTLNFKHIDLNRVFCYRTKGSKARAYARIWQFPKIFQKALKIKPAYVIEVLSKHYDSLDDDNKNKVLIHELLHIPKNFSGSLVPHNVYGRKISIITNKLFKEFKRLESLR